MTEPTRDPIPYATARPPRFNGVAAPIALLLAGLVLIGLGGCFLIGVIDVSDRLSKMPRYITPIAMMLLPWVLYLLAFACFGAAVWMLVTGVRWLYRIGSQ